MAAGNLKLVFVRTDKVSLDERQEHALQRENRSHSKAGDNLAPDIRVSLATLGRETASAEETAQAAKFLRQVARRSSQDLANNAAANRRLLCEAGGVCFGCRALGKFSNKKGGAREAVKKMLWALILPDDLDGKKSPSRDFDSSVSVCASPLFGNGQRKYM